MITRPTITLRLQFIDPITASPGITSGMITIAVSDDLPPPPVSRRSVRRSHHERRSFGSLVARDAVNFSGSNVYCRQLELRSRQQPATAAVLTPPPVTTPPSPRRDGQRRPSTATARSSVMPRTGAARSAAPPVRARPGTTVHNPGVSTDGHVPGYQPTWRRLSNSTPSITATNTFLVKDVAASDDLLLQLRRHRCNQPRR